MQLRTVVLSTILLGSIQVKAAVNIQNDIYNLNNKSNNTNDVFYSKNMGTTYTGKAWGASFTHNYNNGTLIIGNDSKTANTSSTHWFGSGGNTGYITATFNAKDVFLTGTIGSGNSWGTGGGASLTFNASNELLLDSAALQINKAGTQNSFTNLKGDIIGINNSNLVINSGSFNIGDNSTQNLILESTDINMSGGTITIVAQDSILNFKGINATGGTLDLSKVNYSVFATQNAINASEFRFIAKELDMFGDIINGKFTKANLGNGSDFSATSLVIKDRNNTLNANNVQIDTLEFKGPATVIGNGDRNLTINATGTVHITTLTNPYQWAGKGFTSNLKSNADMYIGQISHQNYTGGSWINVQSDKTLTVGSIVFNQDALAGSSGKIHLQGQTVILQNTTSLDAQGKLQVNANVIRPLQILSASGENFYAGTIYAHGLVTAGSNSTLDLSGITKTIFIDKFSIRSGTLRASNFHFNNLSVVKGNSHSNIETNIGKSFVNYFETDLGTSGVDSADVYFRGGGELLNFNLIDARTNSKIDMGSIQFVNANNLNITQANISIKNGIFNTVASKMGQTAISGTSNITANALNINNLLHLKDGSSHSGSINITVTGNEAVVQNFDKYLKVNVSSEVLQSMSSAELQNLLIQNQAQITTDNQNASGTYITTSDGKHYLLLPDIIQHQDIINNAAQALNGGNLLIEQTELTQGALNNYGTILLDAGFVSGQKPVFGLTGNLNNIGTIDIGANGQVNVTGNFENKGKLIFRIQSDPNNILSTTAQNGTLNITGTTTLNISPGSSGAFQADISDAKTFANLAVATAGVDAIADTATYKLINVASGSIQYTYTQGDYTTTFSKNSLTTNKNDGSACTHTNCVITDNNTTHKQETDFSIQNKDNPWDMDKAQTGSNGNKVENGVGEYDNEGNLIQKPSQSDKKCENNYCGFGNVAIQQDPNKTDAEKEIDRGYDYAQEKMKNSFAITYKGNSIDGRYLSVEKVVTDNLIGFRVIKKDINGFVEGDSEVSLCTSKSSTFDCALYMEAGGNNSWINAIKKESVNSYEILKNLFYNDASSILFLVNLDQTLAASRNLEYFLEVGRTLDIAFRHVSDLENKASTLHVLNFAMESARINRLTKASAFHGAGNDWNAFEDYQKNLAVAIQAAENLRFASASDEVVNDVWFDTLADLVMRFNKREEYPNHIWVNALGNLNFSSTGAAQLYGFNAGYDYFIESLRTTFGTYGGYGYGTFKGDNNEFTANTSHNMFAGIYSRTFIGNQEIDIMINSSFGFVNETQKSQINNFDLLDLFSDQYNYMLTNAELNTTYGYAFFLQKGYVIKPFAGMSYYILHSSNFTRNANNSSTYKLNTSNNMRQTLRMNLGIDGRKYFANQSYIFLLGEFKQDIFVLYNNADSNGYVNTIVSADSLNFFNIHYEPSKYQSYVFLTGGGEYSFGRWYLNGSLSLQSSILEKNFGLGMNIGGRMIF